MFKVPKLDQRLGALVVSLSGKESNKLVEQQSSQMLGVVSEIRGSVRLKCLFRVILDLGNGLKHGLAGLSTPTDTTVKGFKLSSLAKLSQTKSNKAGENALDYIVGKLYSHIPDVLQIEDDMPSLSNCTHFSFPKLHEEVSKVTEGLSLLTGLLKEDTEDPVDNTIFTEPNIQMRKQCIAEITMSLASAKSSFEEARSEYAELIHFFGEDEKAATPDVVFLQLQTFVSSVENARNTASARAKRANRQSSNKH